MHETEQPGTIPVWAVNGRPSASADAALLRQIRAELALTPRERVLLAIRLGTLTHPPK